MRLKNGRVSYIYICILKLYCGEGGMLNEEILLIKLSTSFYLKWLLKSLNGANLNVLLYCR